MIGRNGFEQAEKRAAKQSAHGYPWALLGDAGMRSKLKAEAVLGRSLRYCGAIA
jgi:hypothetical protein